MNRTAIHAAIDQKGLLKSNERELLLQCLRDALDFRRAADLLVRAGRILGQRLVHHLRRDGLLLISARVIHGGRLRVQLATLHVVRAGEHARLVLLLLAQVCAS